jgi:hypothetical protein
MLNYEYPPLGGGASPVSYEVAKGYVKPGHSVDVVTMRFKWLPANEVKERIEIYSALLSSCLEQFVLKNAKKCVF